MLNTKLKLSVAVSAVLISQAVMAATPNTKDLTLWLDASDNKTLFTDKTCTSKSSATANAVKCWRDKSDKNNHVKLATNITEPALLVTNSNGKPVVSFSNTALVTDNKGQINGSYTKFAVFRIKDKGGSANGLAKHNLIGSDPYQTTLWADNGKLHSSHDKGNTNYLDSTTDLGTTKFHIAVTRYSKPDKEISPNLLKLDGKEEDRNLEKANHLAAKTSIGGVGSQGNGDNYFYLNGDIAEAIIYDRSLSDKEINDIEKYLATKWSLILSQNIYFQQPDDWELKQGEVLLNAFSSSGLTIKYSSNTPDYCDINKNSPNYVTLKKQGTCTVKATVAASPPFYPKEATEVQSFEIKPTPNNSSKDSGGGTPLPIGLAVLGFIALFRRKQESLTSS